MGKETNKRKNDQIKRVQERDRSTSVSSVTRKLLERSYISQSSLMSERTSTQSSSSIVPNNNQIELNSDDTDYDDNGNNEINKIKFASNKNIPISQKAISSKVLSNFTKTKNKNNYICNLCGQSIATSNRSISNLKSHLGRKHDMVDLLSECHKRQIKRLNTSKGSSMRHKLTRKERDFYHEKAIDAVTVDSCAFNVFRKPGMKTFIESLKPGYSPPNRKTISKRLKINYINYMECLKSCLQKVEFVAITVDLWKNKKLQYFLTITGHFYDRNYTYHSLILSFRKFSNAHSGVNIAMFIEKELRKLDIIEKIVSITTDNEPAVVSACQNLPDNIIRLSCMCHNLNLVVKHRLKLWSKSSLIYENIINNDDESEESEMSVVSDESDEENEEVGNNEVDSENEDEDDNEDEGDNEDEDDNGDEDNNESAENEKEDNDDTNIELGNEECNIKEKSRRYIRYETIIDKYAQDIDNLNDEYNDDENDEFEDEDEDSTVDTSLLSIRRVIQKVRKFIQMVNQSNTINMHVLKRCNELKLETNKFLIDFEVRWNTSYIMIERFLKLKIVVDEMTCNPQLISGIKKNQQEKLKSLYLNSDDWSQLSTIATLLTPFYRSTVILQGQKYHTLSCSKTIEKVIMNYFENNIKADQIKIAESLKQKLYEHLDLKISDTQKNVTKLAAYLDPICHKYLSDDEIEVIEKELKKKFPLRNTITNTVLNNNKTTSNNSNMIDSFAMDMGYMVSNSKNEKSKKQKTITQEINKFKELIEGNSAEFKSFWKCHEDELPKFLKTVLLLLIKKSNLKPYPSSLFCFPFQSLVLSYNSHF